MRRRIDWWLVVILVLAGVFRFSFLGRVPAWLLWDEAALGYNAYSILETGRDEYGTLLPVVFKSFGDFKPGLYVYLAVPAVAVLGLTEEAVRLPAAVFGVVAVWLVYVLVGQMFSSLRVRRLAAFWLAICPWHIFFSRQAWEVGVMTTLILAGAVAWGKFLEKKNEWLIWGGLSGVFLGLGLVTYQSAKFFVPVILLLLVIASWKRVKKWGVRQFLVVGVPILILGAPILVGMLTGEGGRLGVVSIFSYGRASDEAERLAGQMGAFPGDFWYEAFYGDWIFFTRSILGRYLNHFSPRFLFFEGDWQNVRHGVPYMGELFLVQGLFLMLGVWVVAFSKGRKKWFLLGWLVMAPLAAAVTRDNVQAVRAFPMVVPLVVLSAVGTEYWLKWMGKKGWRRGVNLVMWGAVGFQLIYFWDAYLVHMKFYGAHEAQYGYEQAVQLVKEKEEEVDKIVFTTKYGQPYIYWLFYTQYPPGEYQQQARLIESEVGDVGKVERIDKVEFRKIYWSEDRNLGNAILVGDEMSFPREIVGGEGGKVWGDIYFPNGKLAFRIVKTEDEER